MQGLFHALFGGGWKWVAMNNGPDRVALAQEPRKSSKDRFGAGRWCALAGQIDQQGSVCNAWDPRGGRMWVK